MKHIIQIPVLLLVAACFVASCNKKEDLAYYKDGTASALSLSSSAVAPAPSDSDNVVLTVNWTSPAYATDSSTVKYVVEIDSAGRNFTKAVSKTVTGALTTSFTAKDLNAIALGYGFAFNTAYSMDMRLISSYANNNEQKISGITTFKYTPYKIPPKIALPSSGTLFLVGNATQGGWANPVPVPSQQFARIDETTWAGVFKLNANAQYLVLPVNGSWGHKYAVPKNSTANVTSGNFYADTTDNFTGPADSGLYTITLSFQTGKYTVTPYTSGILPDSLYMVGDATLGGWNNPVPVPSQQFTRMNSSEYELTTILKAGKQFLMLPVNGSWSHKFATDDPAANTPSSGSFRYDAASNFAGPTDSATYKVQVNFVTNKYTLTKQ